MKTKEESASKNSSPLAEAEQDFLPGHYFLLQYPGRAKWLEI